MPHTVMHCDAGIQNRPLRVRHVLSCWNQPFGQLVHETWCRTYELMMPITYHAAAAHCPALWHQCTTSMMEPSHGSAPGNWCPFVGAN